MARESCGFTVTASRWLLALGVFLGGCLPSSAPGDERPDPTALPTIEQGTRPGLFEFENVCFNSLQFLLEGEPTGWVVVEVPSLYERVVEHGSEQREFTWNLPAEEPSDVDVLIIDDNPAPVCGEEAVGLGIGTRWPVLDGTASITVERITEVTDPCADGASGMLAFVQLESLRFQRPDGRVVAVEDLFARGDLGPLDGPHCP